VVMTQDGMSADVRLVGGTNVTMTSRGLDEERIDMATSDQKTYRI